MRDFVQLLPLSACLVFLIELLTVNSYAAISTQTCEPSPDRKQVGYIARQSYPSHCVQYCLAVYRAAIAAINCTLRL